MKTVADANFTGCMIHILAHLKRAGGKAMIEENLVKGLGSYPSWMVFDTIESRGWVIRIDKEQRDGSRKFYWQITPAGRKVISRVIEALY